MLVPFSRSRDGQEAGGPGEKPSPPAGVRVLVSRRRRRRGVWPALLGLGILVASCSAEGPGPEARLEGLADRYWDWHLAEHPVQATLLGEERFRDRMPDLSPAARHARREARRSFLSEVRRIESPRLGPRDRLTLLALEEQLEAEIAVEVCRSHFWQLNHRDGPPASLLSLADVQPLRDRDDAAAMVRRWRAMAPYLRQKIANLEAGLARGYAPARRPVVLILDQLDSIVARPDSTWPLLAPLDRIPPAWPDSERRAFREDLTSAVADSVRPLFLAYRDFLRERVLPRSREGAAIGAHALPDGSACYDALVLRHTSLGLSPSEIHRFGEEEIRRIEERMRSLGSETLGASRLAAIQRRLRGDPEMHFSTAEGILEAARRSTDRARLALPDWFGRLPETPIVVKPVPEHEAPYTTVAYYRRPSADGSRPGTYFVNTYAPETRTRYEAEALAFHEGIPGHHLQIALAQELEGLPAFRRHLGSTAFVEGWALYAERLADEMGLYASGTARLGMLSYDAWRASRLVVDTGLHAFGWPRERAVRYMLDHTLLARNNVENEVDRYIAWPGQALAYKLGQREILELRRRAEESLGEDFEIGAFHDRVLENGAVTLSMLRSIVDRWIGRGTPTGPEERGPGGQEESEEEG